MKPKMILHVVGIECPPEIEDRIEKWFAEVHIPMLLKFKGLKKASLYKNVYRTPSAPMFMTTYEFDTAADYEAYEASSELAVARKDREEEFKMHEFIVTIRTQFGLVDSFIVEEQSL